MSIYNKWQMVTVSFTDGRNERNPHFSEKGIYPVQPKSLEKIILSILQEKDLTLTIGQLTHKVRQRTGVFGELRKAVRSAVERLFTEEKN